MKISFLLSASSDLGKDESQMGLNLKNKQSEAAGQIRNYGLYQSIVRMCELAPCLGEKKLSSHYACTDELYITIFMIIGRAV